MMSGTIRSGQLAPRQRDQTAGVLLSPTSESLGHGVMQDRYQGASGPRTSDEHTAEDQVLQG
jgi:hypothetical protein